MMTTNKVKCTSMLGGVFDSRVEVGGTVLKIMGHEQTDDFKKDSKRWKCIVILRTADCEQ